MFFNIQWIHIIDIAMFNFEEYMFGYLLSIILVAEAGTFPTQHRWKNDNNFLEYKAKKKALIIIK